MGRKRKVRYQACSVEVTAGRLLRFRFRWKTPDGVMRKLAEASALRDTPENRHRVERQAEIIGAEIRARRIRLPQMVPHGQRSGGISGRGGRTGAVCEATDIRRPLLGARLLPRVDRAEGSARGAGFGGTRLPGSFR